MAPRSRHNGVILRGGGEEVVVGEVYVSWRAH